MRRISALALLVASLTVACGSAPPLAAADYFPAVENELARLDLATRDLTDRFATELESELESLVAAIDVSVPGAADRALEEIVSVSRTKMQTIIEAHIAQLEVFGDRVDVLVPPKLIATRHAEFVDAFANWAQSGPATVALLQSAADLEALGSVLAASSYADAQLRVDQACRALNDNAAGVEVQLTCPGSELTVLDVGG
ncbi:MAG: hypothetical protein GY720_13440 [bacterium]|nr:hypothetical protein [bacterium]